MEIQPDAGGRLRITGACTVDSVAAGSRQVLLLLRDNPHAELTADLSGITRLDTVGAVWLRRLPSLASEAGRGLHLAAAPASVQALIDRVDPGPAPAGGAPGRKMGPLERLGEWALNAFHGVLDFLYLASDLTWAAGAALLRRRGVRRGDSVRQAAVVGADGLPIVAVILFLVGGVSTLQAAAQLRRFGANVLVADLLAIGITRELGPLMTAIVIAGRSGSAFAAEIASMKFNEEIDALRTMALDPLRLVAVPKMWAMLLTLPLLTIAADFVGLLGGTVTGVLSLDISPAAFAGRVQSALLLKDVLTGLVKSLSFAWIITVVSVYRGLQAGGGAAGVGAATTSSVVSSIFAIIVLDLTWGLVFYL